MRECKECFLFTARLGAFTGAVISCLLRLTAPAWAQTAGHAVIAIHKHWQVPQYQSDFW